MKKYTNLENAQMLAEKITNWYNAKPQITETAGHATIQLGALKFHISESGKPEVGFLLRNGLGADCSTTEMYRVVEHYMKKHGQSLSLSHNSKA
jgi:hypothetical protein